MRGLFVGAARFRANLTVLVLNEDRHRPAADLAIVVEFRRQFLWRRGGDLELLGARRAGDGDEAGRHGLFPLSIKGDKPIPSATGFKRW